MSGGGGTGSELRPSEHGARASVRRFFRRRQSRNATQRNETPRNATDTDTGTDTRLEISAAKLDLGSAKVDQKSADSLRRVPFGILSIRSARSFSRHDGATPSADCQVCWQQNCPSESDSQPERASGRAEVAKPNRERKMSRVSAGSSIVGATKLADKQNGSHSSGVVCINGRRYWRARRRPNGALAGSAKRKSRDLSGR